MKMLNLDALTVEHRSIQMNGVTYPVEDMTVEAFIRATELAEEAAKKKNMTTREQIEAHIAQIVNAVPTIPESELYKQPLERLALISKFLRGEMDQQVESAVEEIRVQEGEQKN